MQGDLISRNDLMRKIEEEYDLNYGEILINPERFYEMVEDMPIAYSVEKVIEQLEERTDLAKNFFTTSKVIHINNVRKYIRNGGKE